MKQQILTYIKNNPQCDTVDIMCGVPTEHITFDKLFEALDNLITEGFTDEKETSIQKHGNHVRMFN